MGRLHRRNQGDQHLSMFSRVLEIKVDGFSNHNSLPKSFHVKDNGNILYYINSSSF